MLSTMFITSKPTLGHEQALSDMFRELDQSTKHLNRRRTEQARDRCRQTFVDTVHFTPVSRWVDITIMDDLRNEAVDKGHVGRAVGSDE